MRKYLIEESGFPRNRTTLKGLYGNQETILTELLDQLPGNRILSGVKKTGLGGGDINVTAGLILVNGKIYSVAAYNGPDTDLIALTETTVQSEFNVGTSAVPVWQDRDFAIDYTASFVAADGDINFSSLIPNRKALEALKFGTIFLGPAPGSTGQHTYEIGTGLLKELEYFVIGKFHNGDGYSLEAPANFVTFHYSSTGFKVQVELNSLGNQGPIWFDYIIVPQNKIQSLIINP